MLDKILEGAGGAGGGASVGGSNTQVQFNDSAALAGAAGLLWDKTLIDLIVKDVAVDANAGSITFLKSRAGAALADSDLLGSIVFKGYNDKAEPELITFASIVGSTPDVSDGTEDGCIDFNVMCQGTWRRAMRITKDTNDFYGVSIGDPVVPLAALHVDSTSLDFVYAAKIVNTIVNRGALYVEGPASGYGINAFGGTAIVGNCAGQGGVGINAVVATNYDGHALVATRNAGNAMGTIGDYPLAVFQVSDQMGATSSLMRIIADCYNVGSTASGFLIDMLHYQTPLYRHTGLNVINHYNNGTAPTAAVTNAAQMWVADYAAGDARLYIMGEKSTKTVIIGDGKVIADGVEIAPFGGAAFAALASNGGTIPARDVTFAYEDAATWGKWGPSSYWTLSNSDLTITRDSGDGGWHRGARGTVGQSAGLKYFEITFTSDATNNSGFGLANASYPLYNQSLGGDAHSWAVLDTGHKAHSGDGGAYITYTSGAVYMVAVNFTTGKVWFGKAGTWVGDPVAGTGEAYSDITGTLYPALSAYYQPTVGVLNVGASAFAHTVPEGFSAWCAADNKITGRVNNIRDAKEIVFDPLSLADHECRGEFFYGTCGETTTLFQTAYRKSDSKFWLSDADAATTMPAVALASAAMAASATSQKYMAKGWARDDSWAWTAGSMLYASTDPGGITQTAPSGSGDQVQIVGWALTGTIIRFDPQLVTVEV